MPVYSGGRFLRMTLDSLLAQEYGHFELLISDNASEDDTGPIAAVRSVGSPHPVLAERAQHRLNRQCQHAPRAVQGDFFMFASDHDLWDRA